MKYLEELGYTVTETDKKIVIDDVIVSQVDAVATDPGGTCYGVEVKAGNIDVTAVRQAYTNAILIGCKPLIIGKGFSDESAEKLAEKLGVKTLILSDAFLIDAEELELIVRGSIESVIMEFAEVFLSEKELNKGDVELLHIIAYSPTIKDLANNLGVSIHEAVKRINELRRSGVLPSHVKDYRMVRFYAFLLLLKNKVGELGLMD